MPSLGIKAGIGARHPPVIPVADSTTASVTLSTQGPTTLEVGGVLHYTARALNAAGRSLPGKTFTATVTDPSFSTKAIVGRSVNLTLTDLGTTTVKASNSGHDSGTQPVVSIAGRVQSFTVNTNPVSLAHNASPLALTIAIALNIFGIDLIALGVSLTAVDSSTSDNHGVCTVSGLTITPVAAGTATVHLTLDDATLDVVVTIT